jgi:hypothetical protein
MPRGNVDHSLKEIIRILLARFANDKYFASLRSTKARAIGLTKPAKPPPMAGRKQEVRQLRE